MHKKMAHLLFSIFTITLLFLSFSLTAVQAEARLNKHTPNSTTVTIAGSLQSELGCPGDWDPACPVTHLAYDANDDVWQGSWTLPAGSYEYKAALNDSWTESYGLHAQSSGANIPLSLPSTTLVKFYYDHKSHWVADNVNSKIVVAIGNFQSNWPFLPARAASFMRLL